MTVRGRQTGPIRFSLLAAILCVLLVPLGVVLPADTASAADPNPIVVENQQQGTNTWQLPRTGFSISDDATGQIKGYASSSSVDKGDPISFHVSVNPAQNFTADIYRMGWYGGLGGRLMDQIGPIAGTKQRTCPTDNTTGIVDCAWSPTFGYTIPDTWTSGVYLVLLTNAAKYQSYITFVVRDDNRTADLLFQQSVTTYQAYNSYPAGTGKSLYEFNSSGTTVTATGTVRAAKVSFDRPYSDGYGSGQFGGNSWNWERYYIGWLEQSGYDVAYSTDLDTHTNGARLLDFKGFLSVGHDEYWSKPMVNAATTARDAGVNLGFFGSNTAYWQVRFEPSAAGAANRVMVCYKSATRDPVKDSTSTVKFREPPANLPEQALVGIQYTAHLQNDGKGAMYVVQNSANWVWEGSGFSDNQQVAGILGYESDRLMAEYPAPPSNSYTELARSPVTDAAGVKEYQTTAIYQAPSGAWVFASGTNHWSFGLGKPGVTNAGIQRATKNVLNRFLGSTPPPPQPPAAPTGLAGTAASSTAVDLTWTDNAGNETGYTVERSPDGAAWTVLNSALPAGTTSYRDTGLAASTAYRYRVKATNAAGSSAYSNVVTVTTTSGGSAVLFAESFPGADGTAWDANRWSVNTGTTASMDVQSGAGRMRFQNVSGARALAVSKMTKQADTETLASFRYTSTAAAARGYLYLASRASGDWVSGYPNTSYFLQLAPDISNVQLWKSQAGTTTSLASVSGVAAVTTAKQWVRFRVEGTTIRAKVWTDGSAEPASWELSATDSSITGGGLIQLRWARASSATTANDVILDDITVTGTSAPPAQPPAAPTGLAGTAASSTAVDLTWTDNAGNETGYTVERSPDGAAWTVLTSALPAGTTSYTDTELTASTTYRYRVKATNAAGSSAYSNVATVTTNAPPAQPPAAPTGLDGTAASSTAVDLTWTDNAGNETGYTVERSPDGAAWTVLTSALPADTTSYTDTELTASTTYRYRVKATNAAGSSAYSNVATVTTNAPPAQPPAAPTGLAGTAASSTAVDLTWTDNAGNETGYTVERSPDGAAWTVLTSALPADTTSYTDTELTASTTYRYRVKATNAAGSSAYSNVATVTTNAPPAQPPAAPTGLAGTAASSTAVDLTWTDNAGNETGYTVERSPDGAAWTVLTSALPAGTTSYTDTELTASTTYRYRVKATNAAGSSAYSNVVTVTTTSGGSAALFAESFPGADGTAWDADRWTVNTGTTASMDVQSGAGRMRFQNVSGARALAISKMTKQADTETLASFRYTSTAAAARGYLYLASRASGDWVLGYPNTSYFLQLAPDVSNVQLWRSQGGATTSLASVSGVASVTTAKQWVRFRVEGTTIRAKVWTEGTAEPTSWELTATDSNITGAGLVQLKWSRSSSATTTNDVILDDITVTSLGG